MPGDTPVTVIEEAALEVLRVPELSCVSGEIIPVILVAFPGMLPMTFAADTVEMEASFTLIFIGNGPGIRLASGMPVILVPRT